MDWQDMSTAPQDGTWIQAEIPDHGSDNVIFWMDDTVIDSNDNPCGCWAFVHEEQEPPACWTDGICWEVNEDLKPSVKPTRWKPLPDQQSNG